MGIIGRWWTELRAWNQLRTIFNEHAVKLGYRDRDYLEAAVLIAERCADAEKQLDRVRRANQDFFKDNYRDRARIVQLERELAQVRESYGTVPGLTPGEIERLAVLAKECGGVAKAIGNVLRFGWESSSPYGGRTNRVALEREIGSIRAIVNLMLDADDLGLSELQAWQRSKRGALAKWTLYQVCSMPREEQLAMMQEIAEERNGSSASL